MTDVRTDNCAQFLSNLRRSPSPGHSQQQSRDAASRDAAQYQLAYLQLQQQMLMQQSQLLLASATQQAMLGHGHPGQQMQAHPDRVDEEDFSRNPLAASALARRKRQSLTLEPRRASEGGLQAMGQNGQNGVNAPNRRVSYGGQPLSAQPFQHSSYSSRDTLQDQQQQSRPPSAQHHRRTSSGLAFVGQPKRWSASTSSGNDTPALVLSKPGEVFPPSPPASDEGNVAPWLAGVQDASTAEPVRRTSQAGALAAALGKRKTSLTVDVAQSQAPVSVPAPPPTSQKPLSPFATTFQPLPPSPFTASSAGQGPPPRTPTPPRVAASAIRQPKGPATDAEMPTSNFSARLRKNAIACLVARGGRLSIGAA